MITSTWTADSECVSSPCRLGRAHAGSVCSPSLTPQAEPQPQPAPQTAPQPVQAATSADSEWNEYRCEILTSCISQLRTTHLCRLDYHRRQRKLIEHVLILSFGSQCVCLGVWVWACAIPFLISFNQDVPCGSLLLIRIHQLTLTRNLPNTNWQRFRWLCLKAEITWHDSLYSWTDKIRDVTLLRNQTIHVTNSPNDQSDTPHVPFTHLSRTHPLGFSNVWKDNLPLYYYYQC